MGCDIHMTLEVKQGNHWLGLHSFEDYRLPAVERNYARFARIAGVRGDGPAPRGMPDDSSELAIYRYDGWGDDGHSHTWLTIDEAVPIFVETSYVPPNEYERDYPASHYFGIEEGGGEYRLVIWFDN